MTWQGKRVVITGGLGFLGWHLTAALVERGAHVVSVDNGAVRGGGDALPSGATLLRYDLARRDSLPDAAREGDMLFHLAAIASPTACAQDFAAAFRVNVAGLRGVLESWRGGRVVFTSSAAVYGAPDYVPIDEEHVRKGRDAYATTKIMGEDLCQYYLAKGTDVTIVRNFNTFGPGQSTAYLIPTLISQALEQGTIEVWNTQPVRDFTFVSDTIAALLAVAAGERTSRQTLNVGTGVGVSVGELADRIARPFGATVTDLKKNTVGSPALICDNSRLRELTGWAPTVTLDEGLERTVAYFKALSGSPRP